MSEKPFPTLVVFDCDGTLVDSQHNVVACMKTTFTAEGLALPDDQSIRGFIGLNLEECVFHLMPEPGDTDLHTRLVSGYKAAFFQHRLQSDHYEPLYPGTLEAIRELDRRGVLMAVATGKSLRGLTAVIEQHSLQDYFMSLQTPDHNPGKPHPQMLLRAMSDAGATPAETVMVGDTSFDMMLARNADCRAIGVSWGYHADEELIKSGAERVIHHFDDLATATFDR